MTQPLYIKTDGQIPEGCDCHLHETQVCDICQGVDGTEVDATPINYRAHAEALAEAGVKAALAQQQEAEPVAVIGDAFSILWIGRGPIAPIIERNGLKVGDKLYARPPKPAAQPQVPDGCPPDIEVREAVADFMRDTQTLPLDHCARRLVIRIKQMLSAAKEEGK